ncbi:MAG TPA: pyruvate carboxylase [Pirellulales bacterium]|jgi:pyruvate carboxylase|nr:pyruvate carboxylase [Pirellulales bacterium]
MIKPIRKLLAANRSEIAIRVFRSAHEAGIRTVAIYSHEDRYALHRFKADEAYEIGKPGEPIKTYLDIDNIIEVAKRYEVDAIHPGYGFLSENPDLARACEAAGITFCGPGPEILEKLGDKITARKLAVSAGVPVLSGSDAPLSGPDQAHALAERLGYPVLLKAAKGGGGRGMRVVPKPDELARSLDQAQREALAAFGSGDVFLEKFIMRPRHIEVQLFGDKHGNLVHLYERDCSLQRRHQKVVEIAPAWNLDPKLRDDICNAAIAIGRAVNYVSAGTVEFLVDDDTGKFYFIEVNPRIQVEHTVTEVVTGIDIVRSQLLVAQGYPLSDPEIGLAKQEDVSTRGFAVQCRVTTEDPENKFLPDYGKIAHYRSAAGMGVRLDAGTAFSGAVVTPFYDSLLVKVIASGSRFIDAARRMERVLQEFRVRGVKTNIPFLINLITHPKFLEGGFTTRFMDETPELFHFTARRDRATKVLRYIGETSVNGHPLVKLKPKHIRRTPAPLPALEGKPTPPGSRQKLQELGPKKFAGWIRDQKRLLLTDTTFRDAHQSLLATRMRTYDMLEIAEAYAKLLPELFSIEMWGGATFDTTMRFLKECPWQRLVTLRERIPNILFQMLFRASNALGYSNYPDNVIRAFVKEAADAGMDLFRIFDSLNWLPNMRVAMEAVLETNTLCEAAICYTGDVLDTKRTKYSLRYYVEMAKELEKMGAHILAIKDMAGLCKPYAAELLVKTLRQEIGIPIHFHTHDTSGVQATAILKAAEAGVDIADGAMGPLSGLTSQPNLGSIVHALRFAPRDTGLNPDHVQAIDEYWEVVREYYAPFESTMKASTADVYRNEMPGGQYTNLYEQAQAVGLASRWHEICRVYAEVNDLFGDIVKVTPSSKAVGDMAIFLVANNLKTADVLDSKRDLAFPESVVDLISGRMGQPPGGFPPKVVERVLRGQKQVEGRPGDSLAPADFDAVSQKLEATLGTKPSMRDVISSIMFPRVFNELHTHQEHYGDTSILPTPIFLYGPETGEEFAFDIEPGKTLIVKFLNIGEAQPDGNRNVSFELNGQPRDVTVRDESVEADVEGKRKAESGNVAHVGAPMPGMVVTVAVHPGDPVAKGQRLVTMEAMKMETTLYAERDGKIAEVLVSPGSRVESGDLLVVWE